jgi:Flp pilus assembly protein CpaB
VGGAPLALPAGLDAISDRWWGLDPRTRTWIVLAGVVALLAGAGFRAAAAPYGSPVGVLVAASDLEAGTPLAEADLDRRRWPSDLAPDDVRTRTVGTLTAPLPAGAVLTDRHVTDGGIAGMLTDGLAAVPLPADLVPELPVGTRLQVVATGVDGEAAVLADDAEVVAEDGTSVWVAVPDASSADVAAAGLRGAVAVAVRGS